MQNDLLIWWLLGLIGVGLLGWFALLGPDARLRRRRRKSHSRIVAKSDRPMVKFSVRPPKEK